MDHKAATATCFRLGVALALLLLCATHTAAGQSDQLAAKLGTIQDAIRLRNARWSAGETPLSDLTPEEMAGYLGALDPPAGAKSARPEVNADVNPLSLPAAFDWRNKDGGNFVTAVRNQSGCGSCWAFATTAALEAKALITLNRPGESFDLSEQTMVSCSGAGSCGGGYLNLATDYLESTGLPLEHCYPYESSNGDCAAACPNWRQSAYKMLPAASVPQTVADLKNAVVQFGPIPVAMRVYSDFQSYRGGIYSYASGGYLGGHAVLIVGYDNAEGSFIAKNSWSDGWGEAGFFRIAYQEVTGATAFGATALAYGAALPPFSPATLGEAVDNTSLSWKTGLAAGWFKQSAFSTYGNDAAQSGAIYEYEPSWIETTVAGPADLSFDERISDNADGYLTLYLDGEDIHTLSYRDRGWQHLVKPLGPGTHRLKWALRPNYGGRDTAWLDHVIVGPASEEISRPAPPSGPAGSVRVGGLQHFETGGAATTLGHPVEHRFDWGDGTRSPWSSRTGVEHTWHAAGAYTVKAQARCGTHTSLRSAWSETLAVDVDPPLPITFGEALDAPALTFQTGGDAAWFAQDTTAYSGGDAVQSGHIAGLYGDGESWISTTVTGPGALQFFWSIASSFSSDLRVSVDGDANWYTARISGRYANGWQQQIVAFGPGTHTITWWYVQDSPDAGGLNAAWIDKIEFLPTYETIPTPGAPTGPTGATVGINYSYSVGAVVSNQEHPLEYRFDWGDGTSSDWSGSPTASHTWSAPINCGVRVQARCAAHPGLVTPWAAVLSVRVGALVTIATPTAPTVDAAAWAGIYATCTTEGGDPAHPGNRQYRFDWGDGTMSAWSSPTTLDKLAMAHRWVSAGTYAVKAQARSSVQTDQESAWSEGLPLVVAALPGISLAAALDNTSLVWTTGGDAGWFGQGFDAVAGGTAAQSGPIADGQSSWFETTVTGPASVSFYWRIAAYSASLTFTDNGSTGYNSDNSIGGETPWAFRVVSIAPGEHTLRWEFKKGAYGFRAPDCARVDKVAIVYSGETVTRASSLGGSAGGVPGGVLPFAVSGATSSQQHAVEYRFDWNDGTFSEWFAAGGASHAWSVPGHYTIRAQTRCAAHPDVVSEWSYQHEVSVSTAPPAAPEGPPAGFDATSYTYTTAGVVPDPGVPVKYIFDWGDGHVSIRSDSPSAAHSWWPGTYQVRVQTVLASGSYACESPWSDPLTVTIEWYETISVPTLDGPASGIVRTPCDYTASGAVSSLGHELVYYFQWDSFGGETGTQATRGKSWTSAGAHTAKVIARCATHSAYKAESAIVTTTVSLPQETVTRPDPPVGPASVTTGQFARYDFTGSTTSLDHAVTYDIDMGDGRVSTLSQQGHYVSWPKAGTYAMRARAHCSLDYANQSDWSLPLTVQVTDLPETITAPVTPMGQQYGLFVGDSAVYTSEGSASSLGHEIEYRFRLGYGEDYSEWSSVPLTVRTWKKSFSGGVNAQARCIAHPTMVSAWSSPLSVYVSDESIARLGTPSGPGSGIAAATYEFLATDADAALGHGREFLFDWGDGTTSGWQPEASRNHAWAAPGMYPVRVKGRCAVHTAVEASSWSYPLNVVIRAVNTLGAAVDAPALTWETGGDAAWFGQGTDFRFDNDAAQSGAVGDSQSAWMQTTVPGPGSISFFWRVSSGTGDDLVLFLDGAEWTRISGEVSWVSRTVPLGTGTHTLLWLYRKDGDGAAGADCGWVDLVTPTTEADLISTPAPPAGPQNGLTAETYGYEAAGAVSSKGHALVYRFDWGDGTASAWSSAAKAEHAWPTAGTYPVVVQARCQAEPTTTSAFSEQFPVDIDVFVENVGAPQAPSGTTNVDAWSTVSFSTGGAVSDREHEVQYRFDWGDESTSPWSSDPGADHLWSSPGVFEVRAQARCGRHQSMESAWSDIFLVAVVLPPERIGTPQAPAGPAGGKTEALLEFSTGGSSSNLRHAVEYRFDWGDGTSSDWGMASSTHAWPTAGSYTIVAQARCAADPVVESAWSALAEVTISDHYDLGQSVDNDALVWETGGDLPWFAQDTTYAWDQDAAQAGLLRRSGNSWISTLVEGPTTVYFLWRTRSNVRRDAFRCNLDGIEKARISGSTPWLFDAVDVDPGVHEIQWEFSRGRMRRRAPHLGWLDLVVTDPREIAGSLAVLTPADQQIWPRRTTVELQWEREGLIGPAVQLQLLARRADGNWVVKSTIAAAIPDTGSYVWRVPASLRAGRYYKIRVRSSADVSISADSPGFFTVR